MNLSHQEKMQNMHLFSAAMILVPSLPASFSQLKIFCNTTWSYVFSSCKLIACWRAGTTHPTSTTLGL
jgi:hypothetical protein